MATKLYKDAVVVTGTYQDASGQNKNRSMNVGSVLQRDDGSFFLVLNRTFNPAGVPNPENRDTLIVNFYDPKPKDGQQPAPQSAARPQPAPANTAMDDDEPF